MLIDEYGARFCFVEWGKVRQLFQILKWGYVGDHKYSDDDIKQANKFYRAYVNWRDGKGPEPTTLAMLSSEKE